MLTAVIIVKLIAEIALLALAAQAVVGVIAGHGRAHNPVYRLLQLVGSPWVMAMRFVLPRAVPGRRLPLIAFMFLLMVWCVAVVLKVGICLQIGVAACR
ncbi:MAG: hypothetical protein V4614_19405 [Pseudomonadota bacterium]